ncbi:DNA-binding response regulator, partial [Micromonospora zamorensis]
MPSLTRVVLAEDEVLLREGLVALLTRFDFTVCAAVGSAPDLLDAAREHEPDLV